MNRLRQWLRYGTVSIVATVTSLTVLGVLVAPRARCLRASANVIATAVGTVPSFELNRRWVWRKTGTALAARRGRPVLGPVVRGPGAVHARP